MRAIDKFILHVVHSSFSLNEYKQALLDQIIQHYKQEADDLNINITDSQLKAYVDRFDKIKPGIISKGGTDLVKQVGGKYEVIVPLSQLIKIVTSAKGVEEPVEEYDITPDVVYNQNGLIIYNGSKEENCLNFGRGESWCITKTSFGNYRYDSDRKNPTFYLVRDTNLPDSDRKSFFVVVVGSDNTYKASDRSNNDVGGRATEWSRWEPWSFIEQNFPSVRGLQNIFKYIPLSTKEKVNQQYKREAVTIREWTKFPFETKKQYLVVRKDRGDLFKDIENDTFVEKYLPKYPQIANFIATNAGIVSSLILVKNLEKFSNQDVKSIIANMRDKIESKYLATDDIPFEVKKLLVKFDKWDVPSTERLYITKDGSTIVKLKLGDDINVGLYQAEDDFPNIKLNKRTSKYLLDYPELDKIPLKNLLKLAQDEIIDRNLITRVLDNAKDDPNSAIIIKPVEDGEIILDSNSFSSYKVDSNGKISSIPFNNEEVQKVFNDSKDNESFQQNALNIFKSENDIPSTIDKDALISVINAIPYNQRTIQYSNTPVVVLTADGDKPFFTMPVILNPRQQRPLFSYGGRREWRDRDTYTNFTTEQLQSYFAYLRGTNQAFDAEGLKTLLGSGGYGMDSRVKKAFIANNPPVADTSTLKPAMNGDTALLINTVNPRESFKISDQSGKLVKANVPTALARQLLGGQAAAIAAPAAGRRGRPAGQPNAPQPAAAPAAAGNINVSEEMDNIGLDIAFMRLPRPIIRKLNVINASRVDPNTDRGASRRNNILGNAGRVGRVIQIGASKIYIIRLANQQIIASINVQPGNSNYILLPNASGNIALSLNSPSELLQALQQRNLAEIHQYLVNEYMDRNPKHLTEFKQLLRKHINEKNEQK
jgi:hypothetical protein